MDEHFSKPSLYGLEKRAKEKREEERERLIKGKLISGYFLIIIYINIRVASFCECTLNKGKFFIENEFCWQSLKKLSRTLCPTCIFSVFNFKLFPGLGSYVAFSFFCTHFWRLLLSEFYPWTKGSFRKLAMPLIINFRKNQAKNIVTAELKLRVTLVVCLTATKNEDANAKASY